MLDLHTGFERHFHAHSAIKEVVELFDQWNCPTVSHDDEREQRKVLTEPSLPCSPNIAQFPVEFRNKIEAAKILDLFDKLDSECDELCAKRFRTEEDCKKNQWCSRLI